MLQRISGTLFIIGGLLATPVTQEKPQGWHTLLFMRNNSTLNMMDLWDSANLSEPARNLRNLRNSPTASYRNELINDWDLFPPDKVRFSFRNKRGDRMWEVMFDTIGTSSQNWSTSDRISFTSPAVGGGVQLVINDGYLSMITDDSGRVLMMDVMMDIISGPNVTKQHVFLFSPTTPFEPPLAEVPVLRPCVEPDPDSVEQIMPWITQETCLHRCRLQGFSYSLLQSGDVCSCSEYRPKGRPLKDCDHRCAGDKTQICGGVDAQTLLHNNDESMCFDDTGDDIKSISFIVIQNMTHELCAAHCNGFSFDYAVVEKGDMCGCGLLFPTTPSSPFCDTPCQGDPRQNCGGDAHVRLLPVKVSEWAVAECSGTLAHFAGLKGDPTFTQDKCVYECSKDGFNFAVVQRRDECVCVNSRPLDNIVKDGCGLVCPGDVNQSCGGSKNKLVIPTRRDMLCILTNAVAQNMTSHDDMTIQMCIFHCFNLGFGYVGLTMGTECHCYQDQPNDRNKVPCTTVCGGDASQLIGGPGSVRLFPTDNIIELLAPFPDIIFNGNFSTSFIQIDSPNVSLTIDGFFYIEALEITLVMADPVQLPVNVTISYAFWNISSDAFGGPHKTFQITEIGGSVIEHTGPMKVRSLKMKILPANSTIEQPTVNVQLQGAHDGTFLMAPMLVIEGFWKPDIIPTSTVSTPSLCPCHCDEYSLMMSRRTQYVNLTEEEVNAIYKEKAKTVKQEVAAAINVSELSSTVRKYTSATDDRASAQAVGYVLGIALLSVIFGSIVLLDITSLSCEFVEMKNKIGMAWKNEGTKT
ncbi:hypothetical protein ScPMuIL_015459 [Solemya velum]